MPRDRNLLIVLADGEHARFVRPAGDNALHSTSAIDSPDTHKQSGDLVSDRPGAAYHSDSSAHHAFAPRHDPHAIAKEKFAQLIAVQLNTGAASGAFDELVVVAPAHVLNEIQDELDASARAKLIGTLAKDLLKTPDDELQSHVRAWVRPVHRPPM